MNRYLSSGALPREAPATRGVVLSLASIDPAHGMMTWLGVGNVQGVLMRANAKNGNGQESLLLRAAWSAPNCLPFKLQCCRSRRGTHFSLQPMSPK